MKQVGVDFTKESAQAMRRLAFVMSPLVVVYTLLASYGIIPGSVLLSPLAATVFSIIWILITAYYFLFPSETKGQKYARLVMYHVLAGMVIVSVTGFASPLTALYALLLIVTHTYTGKRGLVLSALFLSALCLIDGYVHSIEGSSVWVANSTTAGAVLLLGIALIGFMSTQETRRKTLLHGKKQALLQGQRLTTIINNLSDATLSINNSGTITLYNAACLSLLDMNINLKGKKLKDIIRLVDTNGESVNVTDLLKDTSKTVTRDDLLHQYADGESIRLELTYAPIKGTYNAVTKKEDRAGYIVIMRDVTKQKSLEEERDEFISVVSHELRTPIAIAEGTLSNVAVLIDRGLEATDATTLATTVETAHEQILYLARMVNDLSTLSRAERGVLADSEVIDVTALLTSLFHKYEPEARKAQLQLNLDLESGLGMVNVSKLYLEELLQNFITNAIKYTHEGSVTINAKKINETVEFSVKDTGIGMSRTDQAKVFQKFYRSEDYRIRETSGTGLGLYVSSKLAQKLGTKITLKSRVNFGSTFSFSLPTHKE